MPRSAPSAARRDALLAAAAAAALLLVPLPAAWRPLGGAAGALPLEKLAHALLFAAVAALWLRAARPRRPLAIAAVAVAAVAYGGLLELAQPRLADRQAEWGDLGADAAGAAAAAGLWRALGTASAARPGEGEPPAA